LRRSFSEVNAVVLTRLQILRGWRRYAEIVARAARDVCPDAEVYLIGGAAEDRLTVLSDIDILVVVPRKLDYGSAVELKERILEKAEELGLPLYAPVELHVADVETQAMYRGVRVRLA